MKKVIAVDIDKTICTTTDAKYESSSPLQDRISIINALYDEGNYIKYFTARGSTTGIDWRSLTEQQLESWGAKYHELILGKPYADLFIDDKSINSELYFSHLQHSPIARELLTFSSLLVDLASSRELNSTFLSTVQLVSDAIKNKGKIILAGNGGSLSDAQHLCAEFVSRIDKDRAPLPALCLGLNASSITAISNDYSYEDSLLREFTALYRPNDILLVFSTSGESSNIINLVQYAAGIGCHVIGFTGKSPTNTLTSFVQLSIFPLIKPLSFNSAIYF